jgi:eukaryotic-like serine/threonine-protein kinase
MSAVAPPPRPSRTRTRGQRFLDRYELIGELARGGMGTVYLARHAGQSGFQRLFAIKVMHPHLAEEKSFVDMLHDEARIAAQIHHPNVVAIVDMGSQADLHYVVMDYIEGAPFGRLIKRSEDASWVERAVAVMVDTLEGLHAAHICKDDDGNSMQLVHRDVSPQNILVGVDGIARITDFGIAKAETRITSTQPGMRKGKLAFMAPEQITNDEAVDCRADIWSAGVVLWTALTAKNLFRSENDAATIHSVLSKAIAAPSTEGRQPPPFFDAIALRALQRDPNERFSSALEMAEALRKAAVLNGLSLSKHSLSGWMNGVFGEELTARRKAIRTAARRFDEQRESSEYSQITHLPALPSVSGGSLQSSTNLSDVGSAPGTGPTPERTSDLGSITGSLPGAAVTRQDLPQQTLTSLDGESFRAQRRNRLVALGTVATALLLALAVGISALTSKAPKPLPEAEAPASKVATATQPVAAPATASSPNTVPSSHDNAAQLEAGSVAVPASSVEKLTEERDSSKSVSSTKTSRRTPPRVARVAAQRAAAPKEPTPPPEEEASKPRAAPVGQPASGVDKNPYMHR